MRRPVVGILGSHHQVNNTYEVHAGSKMVAQAVAEVAGCLPLIIPANPDVCAIADLVASCDGFLFPGGRPNVHPEEYGERETPAYGTFDRPRDALALPLIRALVERGQPLFGLCLGFQQVNVALGGSLYPEIRELPGRMNHRMPQDATVEEIFALRHEVSFTPGGPFARLLGAERVMTNTLHGQGIKRPGSRVIIDGLACDGTPEALYVEDAPGFALAVQWHPEYRAGENEVSHRLFTAFGTACCAWAADRDRMQLGQQVAAAS